MYHWSDITITNIIIKKKFEILQELPKCGIRDMKWANAVGKIVPVDLLNTGLPQTFNSWKMVSKKRSKLKYCCNKMRFACRYACIYVCTYLFIHMYLLVSVFIMGLPWWFSGREPTCQYSRHGFDPWARKIPWKRKWQPIPVFLPEKSRGQRSLAGYSPWGCMQKSHNLMTKWQQYLLYITMCVQYNIYVYNTIDIGVISYYHLTKMVRTVVMLPEFLR